MRLFHPMRLLATVILVATLAGSTTAAPAARVPLNVDVAGMQPRLVRVSLAGRDVSVLLANGLDVVSVRRGQYALVLEWPKDTGKLARLGMAAEVVDENPGRTAAQKAQAELRSRPSRGAPDRFSARGAAPQNLTVIPPVGSGSMGGYWTLGEIKAKLDSLVADDPYDVVADKIDTIGYSRRWPIWGLRLGKSVVGPDPRPAVLLNSLTHAREPEGMQAVLYFAENLLSRYATDPFAAYLLKNRVIYIVPVVNPDGYEVNQDIYAGSGGTSFGLWRKNIRDNNGNLVFDQADDGVDLNRNYGFRWGKNETGSSSDPTSDLYRGPSAFSEPESQAQRDLVIARAPRTGLSFHTFSDLLLHAWGHTDSTTADLESFREWNDEMTRGNAYQSGPSPHVLYGVNGEFNDWCYGDTLAKPRAFTWTPEIGSDADYFWPPPSRILPLAEENLRECYVVSAIAGPFVQEDGVTMLEGALNASYGARLAVRARNLGLAIAGPDLSGTLTALDSGVQVLVGTVGYPDIGSRQSADPLGGQAFHLAVDDTVTPGRIVRFRVAFTTPDGFYSSDTLSVPLGTATVIASDFASSGLGQWTTATWSIVQNDPAHPSRYFTDSAAGYYAGGLAPGGNVLLKTLGLNLSNCVHAYAFFEARWEIETNYDVATIEASLNGSSWTPLSSTGSTKASGIDALQQPANYPLFTGARWNWKPERADLSAFTGPAGANARLRFRLRSDFGTEYDGFAFDSLRIAIYDPAAQPVLTAVGDAPAGAALALAGPWPNPARHAASFELTLPRAGAARLEILDLQGRHIRTLANEPTVQPGRFQRTWNLRDDAGRTAAPGIYLARLTGAGTAVTRRFVVLQ